MTEPIKCFMLRENGRRCVTENSDRPVYADNNGNEYHLGHSTIIDQDGKELQPAPVGAMWDCDWLHGIPSGRGLKLDRNPDGMVLCVRTPDGDWVIDSNSSGGGSWQRTGTAPNITVTPSILQPNYHGWLRNGELVPA